jgi:hypothetical protein
MLEILALLSDNQYLPLMDYPPIEHYICINSEHLVTKAAKMIIIYCSFVQPSTCFQ